MSLGNDVAINRAIAFEPEKARRTNAACAVRNPVFVWRSLLNSAIDTVVDDADGKVGVRALCTFRGASDVYKQKTDAKNRKSKFRKYRGSPARFG